MKALGAAIDGDDRYKGESSQRTWLHAWQLHFTDQGHYFGIVAPLPGDEAWGQIPDSWHTPEQRFPAD